MTNFLTLNGAEIHDFRHGLHTILAADEFGERVVDAAYTEHDGLLPTVVYLLVNKTKWLSSPSRWIAESQAIAFVY